MRTNRIKFSKVRRRFHWLAQILLPLLSVNICLLLLLHTNHWGGAKSIVVNNSGDRLANIGSILLANAEQITSNTTTKSLSLWSSPPLQPSQGSPAKSTSPSGETFAIRTTTRRPQGRKPVPVAQLAPKPNSRPQSGKQLLGAKQSNSLRNNARNPFAGSSGDTANDDYSSQLYPAQVSVTPRVSLIRAPVESNAILKCLISTSIASGRLKTKLQVHWSRYVYDENLYEQIESPSDARNAAFSGASMPDYNRAARESTIRRLQNYDSVSPAAGSELDAQTGGNQNQVLLRRQQFLADLLTRSRQETNAISDLLIEATLSISNVKASDNASYFCTASDGVTEQSQARIDLIALYKPVVELERVSPARDSKSAIVYWSILSHGNTPIKKTILMVRNDSVIRTSNSRYSNQNQADFEEQTSLGRDNQFSSIVLDNDHQQWQRIDIPNEGGFAQKTDLLWPGFDPMNSADSVGDDNIVRADVDVTSLAGSPQPVGDGLTSTSSNNNDRKAYNQSAMTGRMRGRQRSHNVTSLLPGVTYNFRLAAVNDMGQSNWSYLVATMPNEIPAQISEMFLLSRSNDSLAIGWRRPAYDTAKTIRYEMQLFDLNRTLTLDANTNTSSPNDKSGSQHKTNFMYIFVNLNPGTDYHFHVRACSRAGCSAYSTPKLLASTQDGEPDEPLDVELICFPETGNVSISWLPPANPRGQLLNYSVSLQSQANYRNISGALQLDEWRTTMETNDNHTLNLDASGLLLPNTNYTARVCANNRSKHCGRQNPLTPRATCQTPPELPGEIPPGIRLATTRTGKSLSDEDNVESLALELPYISRRNGSLSCIQVILVRLPKSFNNSTPLSNYLPQDPNDVGLGNYSDLKPYLEAEPSTLTTEKFSEPAIAYLADEIDPTDSLNSDSSSTTSGFEYRIQLGDGIQQICRSLDLYTEQIGKSSRIRAFDVSLKPQTYYTAFIKLILIRPKQTKFTSNSDYSKRSAIARNGLSSQVELLTKTSKYLEPIKTSDNILQVSLANQNSFGDHSIAIKFSSLFNQNAPFNLKEFGSQLGAYIVSNTQRLYNLTSIYMSRNVKVDAIWRYIEKSSPMMQSFEIGLIVFAVSIFLIFVIYLATIPSSAEKRRLRKKLNKKQPNTKQETGNLAQDQFNSNNQAQAPVNYAVMNNGLQPTDQQQAMNKASQQLDVQHQSYGQQVAGSTPSYAVGHQPTECPIHASPQLQQRMMADNESLVDQSLSQQQNIYQQRQQVYQPETGNRAYAINQRPQAQTHYHPHHNHATSQQMFEYQNGGHAHYDAQRNCRTLRRPTNQDMNYPPGSQPIKQISGNMTLNHHSVMALAKRINKSIPIRLFNQVFEFRLRNGWLREEFESLPRAQLASDSNPNNKLEVQRPLVKLRPQLIVSRNDTVSALISGNEHYDASVVRLSSNYASSGNLATCAQDRRIICAKSPLDANSVWDFWRLVYEQEVSTIVMLTQNEDPTSGELRCAHYWPTHDNEETTILSPRNDLVLSSDILPAKFKIRLETLNDESSLDNYTVRRLTLLVMATKASENVRTPEVERRDTSDDEAGPEAGTEKPKNQEDPELEQEEDENELIIVERQVLQIQFHHWNTSSLANQLRIIKFIELANEKHSRNRPESPGMDSPGNLAGNPSPLLVHCINGVGRSGLFAAMSFLIYDLAAKSVLRGGGSIQVGDGQMEPKVNLFVLVSRLRQQRELLVSPYRFYELLYQLTSICIGQQHQHQHQHQHHQHHPQQQQQQQQQQPAQFRQ